MARRNLGHLTAMDGADGLGSSTFMGSQGKVASKRICPLLLTNVLLGNR